MNTTADNTDTGTTDIANSVDDETVWEMIAVERRALAADLDGLTDTDLEAASELAGWSLSLIHI